MPWIMIEIKSGEETRDMDELGEVFDAVSRYFTLLSEPARVRVLHAICQGEKTVSEIVALTGATQTSVSRHLSAMFRAGVLTRRRDGNFVYYGVGDHTLTELCRTVCVHIAARGADAQFSADAGRSGLMSVARDLDPSVRTAHSPGARAPQR
ncbi:MAG: ArsR/SmtB family transcription factor [Gammaproteobacteria bacterium]